MATTNTSFDDEVARGTSQSLPRFVAVCIANLIAAKLQITACALLARQGKHMLCPRVLELLELRGTERASFGEKMRWCTVSACAFDVPKNQAVHDRHKMV